MECFPFSLAYFPTKKTMKKQMETNASAYTHWKFEEMSSMRRILIKMNAGNLIIVCPLKTEIKMQILKKLVHFTFSFLWILQHLYRPMLWKAEPLPTGSHPVCRNFSFSLFCLCFCEFVTRQWCGHTLPIVILFSYTVSAIRVLTGKMTEQKLMSEHYKCILSGCWNTSFSSS